MCDCDWLQGGGYNPYRNCIGIMTGSWHQNATLLAAGQQVRPKANVKIALWLQRIHSRSRPGDARSPVQSQLLAAPPLCAAYTAAAAALGI